MEATTTKKVLSEEQIKAIIADATAKLQEIADSAMEDTEPNYYEDDYGRCYNSGSNSLCGEIEEICYEGLPGIKNDDADIYISASYDGNCEWHDDYDPGDYWTPPSGGIEVDKVEIYLAEIEIEISVYDEETDDYVDIEVSEADKKRIIEEVNKNVA